MIAAKNGNASQSPSGISPVKELNQGIRSRSITLRVVLEEKHFVLLESPISTSFQQINVKL